MNANYYAVKFDAESPDPVTYQGKTFTNPGWNPNARGRNSTHELSRALGVNAYPTLVYFDEKATMLCNECVVERVVKGKALRPARLGFCFTCYVTSHGNDREKMSHTKTIIAPLKAKSLTCIECDGLATVRFGENMYREHVQRQ